MERGAHRTDLDPPGGEGPGPVDSREPERGRSVALFLILVFFWVLLSGRIGIQYLVLMAVSVTIVMVLNPERPFGQSDLSRNQGLSGWLRSIAALFRYLAWLLWSVMKANVDVAYRILHPKLPIAPQLFTFDTKLGDEVAQVLVANTITLTPGTVTIDLADGRYLIHALHPETAGAVISGELQNMVAPIFGDGPDPVPDVTWLRDGGGIRP